MDDAEAVAEAIAIVALRQRLPRQRQDSEVYIWLCHCASRPDETRPHWWAGVQIILPRQRASGVVLCDDGTCYATPHLPPQSQASYRSRLVIRVEQVLVAQS